MSPPAPRWCSRRSSNGARRRIPNPAARRKSASETGDSPEDLRYPGLMSVVNSGISVDQQAAPVTPENVHRTIARHMLADGFDLVLDLDASRGSTLVDARNGVEYLDLFTFFASSALGMNHPALADDA